MIELSKATEAQLKELFDQSWDLDNSDIDYSGYFDDSVPLPDIPDVPLIRDIALEMCDRRLMHWEHLGWPSALNSVLHELVYSEQFDKAQAISEFVSKNAPKGLKGVCPDVAKYAAGQFPLEDIAKRKERTNYLIGRMKANRAGTCTPNPVPIWKRLETEMA